MNRLCGIDYSITTPAMVTWEYNDMNDDVKLDNIKFYCIIPKELKLKNVVYKIFNYESNWDHIIERYEKISDFFMNIIKYNKGYIGLEGYSFASRQSLIFNIAENTAILKYHLWEYGRNYNIFAPQAIKKFATGKGNSKKEEMVMSANKKFNIDFSDYFNVEKINPLSDLIDALWILLFLRNEIINKKIT